MQRKPPRSSDRSSKCTCGCSTVRGGGRLKVRCSSLPIALRSRVLAARTTHLQVECLCLPLQRKPPCSSDRSSKLTCGCSTVLGGGCLRVLAARTTHLQVQVVCLCNGSRHMQLGQIEQAFGYSTVRGEGGLKDLVRCSSLPLRIGTRVKRVLAAACDQRHSGGVSVCRRLRPGTCRLQREGVCLSSLVLVGSCGWPLIVCASQ